MNKALTVAKKRRNGTEPGIRTLSTGIKVKLIPVPAMLIEEVQAGTKDPSIPQQTLEDGRIVENPTHPEYLEKLATANRKRSQAAVDAMVLFGIELVNGLPKNESWLQKLKYLEKRGHLNLSEYDLTDSFDLEFIYKKHIAMASSDWIILGEISGIRPEAVEEIQDSFQSNT